MDLVQHICMLKYLNEMAFGMMGFEVYRIESIWFVYFQYFLLVTLVWKDKQNWITFKASP